MLAENYIVLYYIWIIGWFSNYLSPGIQYSFPSINETINLILCLSLSYIKFCEIIVTHILKIKEISNGQILFHITEQLSNQPIM